MHSTLDIQPTGREWKYVMPAWIHHPFEERLIKAVCDTILHGHFWLIHLCSIPYSAVVIGIICGRIPQLQRVSDEDRMVDGWKQSTQALRLNDFASFFA